MIRIKVSRKDDGYQPYCTPCYKDKNSKYLTHVYYDKFIRNKLERLLFLSSIEYETLYEYSQVTLYTLKEFEKYIDILRISDTDYNFTYDKKKVEMFYD